MQPDIIFGPPGCGKTTSLINRVESALARGIPPDRIGYFSFTRRAAQEAVERACSKFGLHRTDFPYFSTFHSMCFKQLGINYQMVLSGKKLREFAHVAKIRINSRWSEDGTLTGFETGDRILFMENLARVRGITLEQQYREDDDNLPWEEVKRVALTLADYKKQLGFVDFTDMLMEYLRSGIRLRLQELMVDETQDLSLLQWRIAQRLSEGCDQWAVAGDDDQAIYRWAGADVDQLIDLQGNTNVLGQSYRVPRVIQKVAQSVIGQVHRRREKLWRAREGAEGEVARAARFIDVDCGEGEILVLARNAYVLNEQVEPELRQQGIVFERNGRNSIDADLLRTIQDWEKLRREQMVTVAQARKIYKYMSSGHGIKRGFKTLPDKEDSEMVSLADLKKTGGLLRDEPWHEAMDMIGKGDVDYIRAARTRGEKLTKKPRVVLSTIHGAKGGQADHVVLMKEIAWRSYNEMLVKPEDEMRVWYVGATRAKEKLSIVEPSTKNACPWL